MSVHRDALRNAGEVVLKTISLLQVVVGSPFLPQQLSNLVWLEKETHRHDSHTLGPGQSPNHSLLWDSPYDDSFCFEKPSEQSWV